MFSRKHRPLTFDRVYGLEDAKAFFQAALQQGAIDIAYLLSGSQSTGKTTLARIFVRAALCHDRQSDQSPCNKCPSCIQFIEDRHPCYTEVDAANYGSKEHVQEIKDALSSGWVGDRRYILFDEAHGMSSAGKDAMLKLLEAESTNYTVLFGTTEPDKMPKTLSSRCIQLALPDPSEIDVVKKLRDICAAEEIKYEDDGLGLIALSSSGYYRDAENRLRYSSLLGGATIENAKRASGVMPDAYADMLLALPKDISAGIALSEMLSASVGPRGVYFEVVRILKDAAILMAGRGTGFEWYDGHLKRLGDTYGQALYDMLDYLMTRTKLDDRTYLQADLLVLHHKFLRGSFRTIPIDDSPKREVGARIGSIDPTTAAITDPNLKPWERDEAVRTYRLRNQAAGADNRVPERVSQAWGPAVKDATPPLRRGTVSRTEFSKIITGESSKDGKV